MGLNRLQIGTALSILLKTTPLLLIRLGVYLAFWVVLLIYLGVIFGLGYLLSQLWAPLGIILGILAFGSTFFIYRLAYRYVFYLLKAAHLAIVAELLQNGSLPPGVGQLAWGREQVTSRFGQVSIMFVVDELVTAIVRTVTNTVVSIANMLPGDMFRNLARVLMRVVEYATNYVDEAILARSFWRKDESVWQTAEEGIILYAMVWKPLLMNAVALMILSYVPFLLTMVILAAPVGFLLGAISPTLGAWSVLFVLILSFFVKVAVGDSFAMIAMVAAYQRETQGLRPDPAMEARIAGISDKFRDLKSRAMQAAPFGGSQPGGQAMDPNDWPEYVRRDGAGQPQQTFDRAAPGKGTPWPEDVNGGRETPLPQHPQHPQQPQPSQAPVRGNPLQPRPRAAPPPGPDSSSGNS